MRSEREVKMIANFQIKKMWSLASKLNMTKDDLYALAGVEHLHDLTYVQANDVVSKLLDFEMSALGEGVMINKNQEKKIWALMYELKKYDTKDYGVSVGDRLCKIIEKELKITARRKNPFIWIDYKAANKLIEILKKYVANAKRKAEVCGKKSTGD